MSRLAHVLCQFDTFVFVQYWQVAWNRDCTALWNCCCLKLTVRIWRFVIPEIETLVSCNCSVTLHATSYSEQVSTVCVPPDHTHSMLTHTVSNSFLWTVIFIDFLTKLDFTRSRLISYCTRLRCFRRRCGASSLKAVKCNVEDVLKILASLSFFMAEA